MVCSFCRCETRYLAKGPGVSICQECVKEASARFAFAEGGEDKCSFCNKKEKGVFVSAETDTRICSDCLLIAQPVVEHQRMRDRRS
jgi:hypothetical protein